MLRIFLINEWVLCTPAYYPLLPFSLSHQFQFVNATFVRHLPSWNMIRVPRQIHARCRCKFGSKYSSNVWRWTLTAHHFVLFWSRATGFMSSNEYIANSISRSVWQGHVFRRQQNTHTHTHWQTDSHIREHDTNFVWIAFAVRLRRWQEMETSNGTHTHALARFHQWRLQSHINRFIEPSKSME